MPDAAQEIFSTYELPLTGAFAKVPGELKSRFLHAASLGILRIPKSDLSPILNAAIKAGDETVQIGALDLLEKLKVKKEEADGRKQAPAKRRGEPPPPPVDPELQESDAYYSDYDASKVCAAIFNEESLGLLSNSAVVRALNNKFYSKDIVDKTIKNRMKSQSSDIRLSAITLVSDALATSLFNISEVSEYADLGLKDPDMNVVRHTYNAFGAISLSGEPLIRDPLYKIIDSKLSERGKTNATEAIEWLNFGVHAAKENVLSFDQLDKLIEIGKAYPDSRIVSLAEKLAEGLKQRANEQLEAYISNQVAPVHK